MYQAVFKCLNPGETPAAKGAVGQTNWLPCASGVPYRAGHAPACWVKTPWERLNRLRQEPTSYFQKCFLHVVNQVSSQITSRQTKSLGFNQWYPGGSPRTHVNPVPPSACSLCRQYWRHCKVCLMWMLGPCFLAQVLFLIPLCSLNSNCLDSVSGSHFTVNTVRSGVPIYLRCFFPRLHHPSTARLHKAQRADGRSWELSEFYLRASFELWMFPFNKWYEGLTFTVWLSLNWYLYTSVAIFPHILSVLLFFFCLIRVDMFLCVYIYLIFPRVKHAQWVSESPFMGGFITWSQQQMALPQQAGSPPPRDLRGSYRWGKAKEGKRDLLTWACGAVQSLGCAPLKGPCCKALRKPDCPSTGSEIPHRSAGSRRDQELQGRPEAEATSPHLPLQSSDPGSGSASG